MEVLLNREAEGSRGGLLRCLTPLFFAPLNVHTGEHLFVSVEQRKVANSYGTMERAGSNRNKTLSTFLSQQTLD